MLDLILVMAFLAPAFFLAFMPDAWRHDLNAYLWRGVKYRPTMFLIIGYETAMVLAIFLYLIHLKFS